MPSVAGQDTASLVLGLLLVYAKFLLLRALSIPAVAIGNATAPIGAVSYGGLIVISLADLVALFFNVFLIAILVKVILSWISPGNYNPAIGLIDRIASPVLKPVQRFIPPIGGLDLSPLFAMLALMVAKLLVVPPIVFLGQF